MAKKKIKSPYIEKEPKKRGRKTVMTEIVLRKIEEAAAFDATVEEIVFYAGISRDTYDRYMEKNKNFAEKVKQLRMRPVLAARQTIVKAVSVDANLALKYLGKKCRKEFGDQVDLTTGGEPITSIKVTVVKSDGKA